MDVIALHQAGFDNAVASLGTAFTSGQANLLKRYTKEVYITYDSDGAGVRAALRAIPILKEAGLHAKVVNMQPHKDPDEFITSMGKEAYEKRIEEAENGFLFEVRIIENDYDLKDTDGNVYKQPFADNESLITLNAGDVVEVTVNDPEDEIMLLTDVTLVSHAQPESTTATTETAEGSDIQ